MSRGNLSVLREDIQYTIGGREGCTVVDVAIMCTVHFKFACRVGMMLLMVDVVVEWLLWHKIPVGKVFKDGGGLGSTCASKGTVYWWLLSTSILYIV